MKEKNSALLVLGYNLFFVQLSFNEFFEILQMQKTRKTLLGDFNYCSTTSYKKKNRFSVKH